jgi:hypothetical protein
MLAAKPTVGIRRHVQITARTPFFITSSLVLLNSEKILDPSPLAKASDMPN